MKLRHVYLFLFVLGTLLPFSQFVPWVSANGLDLRLFFSELFSTKISSFFALDVFVSALVLLVFAAFEAARLKMRDRPIILMFVFLATFCVGVSSGFPLFLYLRQRHIDGKSDEKIYAD
jgi:ABC-type glycerol-3-phosphate transport system permease component